MKINLLNNSMILTSNYELLPDARWNLISPMFVLVSNYSSYQEFCESSNVIGSIFFLYGENDDWHFRKSDGLLSGLCFRVPEKKLPTLSFDVMKTTVVQGRLSLEFKRNTTIESMSYRYFDIEHKYLVCLSRLESKDIFRVRVCSNLYLLVQDEELLGWLLLSPIECLDIHSKDPIELAAKTAIGLYMEHFHEDSYEDIEDGVYEDLAKIERIKKTLNMENGVSIYVWRAISEALDSLL